MKKTILKNGIILFLILSLMLISLTGCSANENEKLVSKTENELSYLENKLTSMANKLNNINFEVYMLVESTNKEQSTGESGSSEDTQNQGGSGQQGGSSGESSSGGSSGGNSNSQSQSQNSHFEYGLKQESVLGKQEKDIEWDYIKTNAEILYSTWTTVIIDLHSLNVENTDILNFGTELDNLMIAAKNENKSQTLKSISNLYSYIPSYIKQFSGDSNKTNLAYTKYSIINAYSLTEEDNWDEIRNQINNAKEYFSNILNGVDENGKYQSKKNKVYVLLNELDNVINLKDKELFFVKYKALMEDIGEI